MENQCIRTAPLSLTGTGLKTLALAAMVLDHIHYFFSFTGQIPDWFSMAGRLAAPLFVFCLAEGFAHTHSRKTYFLRIWLIAAVMGGLLFFMMYGGFLVRPDGFYPANAALSEFVLLMVIWQGIDWLRQKRIVLGAAAVIFPFVWPVAAGLLSNAVPGAGTVIGLACYTVLPILNMSPDVSLPYVLMGIWLYLWRTRRAIQVAGFAALDLLFFFALPLRDLLGQPGFSLAQMFTQYYEWFGAFAGLLMLCYNGRRGAGHKGLFYVFYPAHIYLLYALSWAVLVWLR